MQYSILLVGILVMLGMIYVITVAIVSLFLYFSIYRLANIEGIQKQAEARFIGAYTKNLEARYNEMRKFRHDHLSLLHGFAGFIDNETRRDLKDYLQKNLDIAEKTLAVLDKAVECLQPINIPELKGLLAVKFAEAQACGIDVNVDVAMPVEDIPLERTDLCRIAGIMVENAVEEMQFHDYERKLLQFGIVLNGDDTVIICANTCWNPPPIEAIFKKDFSTKGEGRGLGLYIIKQICAKNGNAWVAAHTEDDGMFTITITIAR